jgi:hypothetical protein
LPALLQHRLTGFNRLLHHVCGEGYVLRCYYAQDQKRAKA